MRVHRSVMLLAMAALTACQARPILLGASSALQAAGIVPSSPATGYGVLDAVSVANLRADVWAMFNAHKTAPQTTIQTPWGTRQHSGIASYVANTFERVTGLEAVRESFVYDGYAGTNVYLDIPGATHPDRVILVSGHHDTWWNGADDDTSAIAAMIEAARILATRRPADTIRFVAFDGEELGDLGAHAFIDAHEADSLDYLVDINMEGMAFASAAPNSQESPTGLPLPSTANFMLAVANEPAQSYLHQFSQAGDLLPAPYQLLTQTFSGSPTTLAAQDLRRGDHDLFWQIGFPAVFFTDTLPFRNANYHMATDTPNTLDFGFMERSTQTLVGALALISGAKIQ